MIDQKIEKSQIIGYNNFLIEADVFKNNSVYSDIIQPKSLKKDNHTKVLSYEKQAQLDNEIENIFPNFI